MKDYHSILGLARGATEDEIKKAYRKLANIHHPDKGGDEEKFKEVKEAYEKLTSQEPEPQHHQQFQDINEIHRQMREAARRAWENAVQMIELQVDIAKAYEGAKIPIHAFGNSIGYDLRAGLPQGVTFQDEVPVGDRMRRVQITLNIVSKKFAFARPGTEDGFFFSGDLITDVEVDALTIMTGGYIVAEDFLGKKLQVRVPAGHDPRQRLRVAKHGYSNWEGDKAGGRGDLYLRVIPKFQRLADIDHDRLRGFIEAAQAVLPVTNPAPVTDSKPE